MNLDRLKTPLQSFVRSVMSRVDYYAMYRAQVVVQKGNTVDVIPDDTRLPPMSGIPLRHGLPGVSLTVQPGTWVMVSWSGGDPQKPYAQLWEGGETVVTLSIGGSAADNPVLLQSFLTLFNTHTHSGGTMSGNTGVPTTPATSTVGASIVKVA